MNNGTMNILNSRHALSQTSIWSGYMVASPVSRLTYDRLCTHINLPSNSAPNYTTPIYDLLDYRPAITPLSPSSIDERPVQVSSTNMVMSVSEHSFSIVVFSNLTLQTPYSIASVISKIAQNGLMRLRECLGWLSVANAASMNVFTASYGTNTLSPTERSLKDLILARNMLDIGRCEKFNQMIVASDQYSTGGVPHTYAMVMSQESAADLDIIFSTTPYLQRQEQHANIREYSEVYKGCIPIAQLSLLTSSELPKIDGSNSLFIDYIFARNCLYSGKGPFTNGISIRDASQFPARRTAVIDAFLGFSSGVVTSRMLCMKSTPAKK